MTSTIEGGAGVEVGTPGAGGRRSAGPVGPHHDEVVLGPHGGGVEAGLGQPVQLVGQRGGTVVVGGQRGHRVGRVDGDHDIAEHEAAAGTQDAGDAGEQVRLVGPLQVVDGQRRDDEVEGAGGQRVGRGRRTVARRRTRPDAAAPRRASPRSCRPRRRPRRGEPPARPPASPPSRSRGRAPTTPSARPWLGDGAAADARRRAPPRASDRDRWPGHETFMAKIAIMLRVRAEPTTQPVST